MNNNNEIKERVKGKTGPKPKPKEQLCREGRFMVNIPPVRIPQLKRVAAAQGLPMSSFMRQAIFNRLDDLDRAA